MQRYKYVFCKDMNTKKEAPGKLEILKQNLV